MGKNITVQTNLFKHQRELFIFARERAISLNVSGTGTGKTLAGLTLAAFLIRTNKVDDILIISPKNVSITWEDELIKHLGSRPNYFHLFSYDLLRYHDNRCLPTFDPKRTLLILDEFRKIKNPNALQSKTLLKLQHIQFKYFLDGTPIVTSPEDLFFPLKVAGIWPFKDMTVRQFRKEYMRRKGVLRHFKGKEFKEAIKRFVIRKTKDQCLDLPPKLYTNRWYELSSEQLQLYERIRKELRAEVFESDGQLVKIQAKHITSRQKLNQICSGFCYGEDGHIWYAKNNPKIDCLADIIKEISKQPFLLWVVYDAEEILVKELLHKMNRSFAVLSGASNGIKRTQAIRAFCNADVDALVLKLQSGASGLNLQRATAATYLSNLAQGNLRPQSEDRCHRSGTIHNVTYFDILSRGKADDLTKQKIDKNWSEAELFLRILE